MLGDVVGHEHVDVDAVAAAALLSHRLEPDPRATTAPVDQVFVAHLVVVVPDAAGRRRLIELYDGAPLSDGDALVARLDGVAPAFIKELARRAALMRLQRGDVPTALTDALDAMLEHATPVLRRSLSGPASEV
jgi:hypothetical protein